MLGTADAHVSLAAHSCAPHTHAPPQQFTVTTGSGRTKNTTLLRRSAQLVRCLHGARMTACKSAKDRTAMSVTLEQARLLREHHALRESDVERVTNLMRRHGA